MISFRRGYKYQLASDHVEKTGIPNWDCEVDGFVELDTAGQLVIHAGYAWDGPSGPTIDTKSFMRGSLVHDALYQLMREGELPVRYRFHADRLLRLLCLDDGMPRIRAWWVYHSVRMFGGKAVHPSSARKVESAP